MDCAPESAAQSEPTVYRVSRLEQIVPTTISPCDFVSPSMPPDLTFSERFEAISKVQHVFASAHPQSPASEAQEFATTAEQEAFDRSNDVHEYQSYIDEKIQGIDATFHKVAQSAEGHDSLTLPEGGVPMGRYTNATHHVDGLFSSIFKAVAPENSGVTLRTPGYEKLPLLVALKVTNPSAMGPPHDSEREVRLLKNLHHPYIIELLENFQQAGGRLILAFPFMPLTLEDRLTKGQISQSDQIAVLSQLMEGLAYVHGQGIIHRDVKPSNILLKSPHGPAYLADFGIAWSVDDPGSEPADSKILDVGTTSYRPPELLFGNQSYNTSLDMWATGCVVAQVVSLGPQTLFDAGDLGSELALIKSIFSTLGTPNLEVWPEAGKLPDWGKMAFHEYPARPWKEILPRATDDAVELVRSLVVYESGDRMKAADWRKQRFFN